MKYFPSNLTLPEFFKYILKNCKTIDEKSNMVAQWNRKDLHWFVDFLYNGDSVRKEVVLPEFKTSKLPAGNNYSTILSSLPRINSAIQNRSNKIAFDRSMKLVLESISADESALLVDLFNGKEVDGIPKAVFVRSLPMYFRNMEN